MSIVPTSQFSLIRARRELDKACERGDWEAVRYWDAEIAKCLSQACDDERRDPRALIDELERILGSYSSVASKIPEAVTKA